jgi:chromosome segregation ATPase
MIEAKLRELKAELEQATAMETNRAAREGELSMQLQAAQNQISDSRARIAEMERALDTAIQQLLKQK